MTTRIRLFSLTILAVVATLSSVAVDIVAGASGASAASSGLREGGGYRVGNGDFVGYYVTGAGTKVYCLSPRKALPGSVSLHTTSRYPGASVTTTRRLTYALQRWGNATGRAAAAVESQVLNAIVGNTADVRRRAASLPRSLAAVVQRRVLLARRLAGPFRVSLRLPTAVLPGQSAAGSVRVLSASGVAVPGVSVRLHTGRNAQVPARVVTGAGGTGRFDYRATDIGRVRVTAAADGLPLGRLRLNSPASYQQRMVTWAGTASVTGSAGFSRAPAGFSGTYSCGTACAGRPAVTLRACAAWSAHARRIVWRAGSRQVVLTFAPATSTVCRTSTIVLADGDRVSGAWQFHSARGWSRPVPAKGSFVVDCPPVPAVQLALTYDCTAGRFAAALPTNTSVHPVVLVIGGAAQRRIVAARGQRAAFSAAVSCARPQTYTVQAGVQRAGGDYHYGPVATVATPRG